jgi:Effector Associated Constant Component 1
MKTPSNSPGQLRQQLLISVTGGPHVDDAELERLSRRLRAELLQLDVEAVAPIEEAASAEGTKSGGMQTWSTLALTFAASGGVLTTIINALRDWIVRQPALPSIKVSIGGDSIELDGVSAEERQQLIQAFIARHGQESGD